MGSNKGFTLIEVLVALVVLVFISMASHQILASATDANEASEQKTQELAKLNLVFRLMEQDFTQLAHRFTRNESGDYLEQSFIADRFLFDSQYHGVAMVRDGWRNPAYILPRSELQMVSYVVEEEKLLRKYRVFVDEIDGSEPRAQTLIDNVDEFKLLFRGKSDSWEEKWDEKTPPRAVKVELTIDELMITRSFLLPQAVAK